MEQNENTRAKVLPFYDAQLRHLVAPRATLAVTCGYCGHKGDLDPVELGWRLGPYFRVRHLESRLKCQGCAVRGWCHVSLAWLG